jgi:hypothetical protein
LIFDTSSIGSGVVDSGVLSSMTQSVGTDLGTDELHVVEAVTALNNDLSNSDYQNMLATSFASETWANLTVDVYEDFTLNESGRAKIIPTGLSKFGIRTGWDLNNSFTGTWVASVTGGVQMFSADEAGNSKDPKLVVTYVVHSRFLAPNKLRPAIFSPGIAR